MKPSVTFETDDDGAPDILDEAPSACSAQASAQEKASLKSLRNALEYQQRKNSQLKVKIDTVTEQSRELVQNDKKQQKVTAKSEASVEKAIKH